uniref:histidine kinase n=1 Tax=Rhodopseudomonas palustris (strain BisA53) TaxID=316055 RepID=Q07VR7_RHOP5
MRWRRLLLRQEQIGTGRAIALALICVAVATLARAAMGLAGALLPFPTFFPAELIAALIGGPLAGLLTVALSLLVVWSLFMAPVAATALLGAEPLGDLALFTLSGLVIVWLASLHRQLVFELEENEKARSTLAREIQHRSANLLLVMTSLVRQSVPDPAVATALIDRMRTVAKSDDLLDPSRGPGPARLAQLVEDTVRRPYGTHVSMAGPDVGLDAAQAHGLRLMLHEMATNAAKYGALSDGHGRVSIDWRRDGDTLNIVWRESGGPTVAPPTRNGFGSKLIQTMLQEIKGTLVSDYVASGYAYTITLRVGDSIEHPADSIATE